MSERLLAFALAVLALVVGPGRANADGCTLQKIADLPVTMAGMEPMVSAQINGQDARLFIDTGSFFSMLNPASVAKFGLKLGSLDPRLHIQGATGEVNAHVTTVQTLTFVGLPFREVEFLVGEHAVGPADGLLGQNVLGGPDVEYDFANGVARLFRPKDCGSSPLAYWAQDGVAMVAILPMDEQSRRVVATGTLNGVKIRVLFDSGAARSVLSVAGARRAGVRTDGPDVIEIGGGSGAGARVVRSWIAPFQSFEIGGEQVKATRIRIADLDLHDADMLLGADFFLSHHIYIARSQNRVYFTYNGGPVFNLEQGAHPAQPPAPLDTQSASLIAAAPPAAAAAMALRPAGGETPKDAAEFERRAAAEMARRDFDAAIADDSQAIARDPADATFFYHRSAARLMDHQPVAAVADLDQALKLKPDYAAALALRGQLKLARKDQAGAKTDLDAALIADPNFGAGVAQTYLGAGMFADADRVATGYIASHPHNEDLALALGVRCRARAFSGEALDEALKDCDAAIRYRPGVPEAYASRGLVLLRQGRNDQAIADFNETIRLLPRAPWALYGRGLAEARKGLKAQSEADFAAAAALVPHIADDAKKAGLAS